MHFLLHHCIITRGSFDRHLNTTFSSVEIKPLNLLIESLALCTITHTLEKPLIALYFDFTCIWLIKQILFKPTCPLGGKNRSMNPHSCDIKHACDSLCNLCNTNIRNPQLPYFQSHTPTPFPLSPSLSLSLSLSLSFFFNNCLSLNQLKIYINISWNQNTLDTFCIKRWMTSCSQLIINKQTNKQAHYNKNILHEHYRYDVTADNQCIHLSVCCVEIFYDRLHEWANMTTWLHELLWWIGCAITCVIIKSVKTLTSIFHTRLKTSPLISLFWLNLNRACEHSCQ